MLAWLMNLGFAGGTAPVAVIRAAQKRQITLSASDIRNTGTTPTQRNTGVTPSTRNTGITPDD